MASSIVRTLTTNFVGRTKNLEKSFKRVAKGSELMSDKLMKATRMAGIGFTALGGVAVGTAMALKPMIDKAADVEESLSKNNVVFGDSARAVEQFATRSLQAFGVTRREALEATGVIGTLGSAMGMAEADSAKMATTLVGLAGDMSSFNNASVEETLTAIQAGLRGENEPLRRFGVLLDAVTLKAKALEKGIIKNTKDALTPQAKALAAYEVILEQTKIQMGDFERTSDSATNQQKLFAGAVDDLQVALGEMLLPTFTAAAAWMNENLVPWAQELLVEIETKGPFRAIGNEIGEQMRSGTEIALGDWAEDTTWWNVNLINPVLDWMIKAGAVIGEGAGLWNLDDGDGPPTRGPGSRGGRGGAAGAAPAGTDMMSIIAQLEEAAQAATEAAAEAKAEPMPGLSAAEIEVMVNNAAAKAAADALTNAAAAAAVDEAFSEAFNEPSKEASAAAAADAGGAAAAAAAAADAEVAAWLGSPEAQAMFAGFTGDPGQRGGATTVNNHFNITGVSPSEVMEAIGQAVDLTGPMPPHWQQSATD